jgi:tRNA-specific 2-thiouridylase
VKEVQLHSVNWIESDLRFKIKDLRLKARYRHQGELVKVSMEKLAKDLYRAVFESPQKAVASGQSMVLYKGKECVGGGVIV